MRILLDTHIWLWWLNDDKALKKSARSLIESSDHEILVSVISLWEATIKSTMGKLKVVGDLEAVTTEGDLQFLPFVPRHVMAVAKLPLHHRDPFDRALLGQAAAEGLRLLTVDTELAQYASVADVVLV